MNRLREIGKDDGFTIQELLVVIIAGGLLVGFALGLYAFVAKAMGRSLNMREHHETAQRIATAVALDIERSTFVEMSDSLLVMESPYGRRVSYDARRQAIRRNGMLMHPEGEGVWSLTIEERLDSLGRIGRPYLINVKGQWAHDSCSVNACADVAQSSASQFYRADVQRHEQQCTPH